MGYLVAYDGKEKRVVWAVGEADEAKGKDYFDALPQNQQAKLFALFVRFGDLGRITNPEKFRHEEDGLFCFKSFQQRLMCFIDGRDVVITHGFTKKSPKIPRSELQRGDRLRHEYIRMKGSP